MEQTYPIYEFAAQKGTLQLQEDGLYVRLEAAVVDEGRLIRIYFVGQDATVLLGTALPEQGRVVCRRKLSRHQLPAKPLAAFVYCEQFETWQKDADQWRRMTPERVELAQPYEENAQMEQVESYPQLQTQTIDEQPCLVRSVPWADFLSGQLEA